MSYFLKWLLGLIVRIVALLIGVVKLPLQILQVICGSLSELLQDLQNDLCNCCPWPWIDDFEKRWELSRQEDKELLLREIRRGK